DIRADVYSLGCTLYFLLAGRPPFQADTPVNLILAHLQEEARPLTELRSDLPGGLWEVVERLLAKDPAQRFPTSQDAARALLPYCGFAEPATGGHRRPDALLPAARSPASATSISRVEPQPEDIGTTAALVEPGHE